jgi:hypothetical protein
VVFSDRLTVPVTPGETPDETSYDQLVTLIASLDWAESSLGMVRLYTSAHPTGRALAAAIGEKQGWVVTGRPSDAEAENDVLERCQQFYGEPCVLLARGEQTFEKPANGDWPHRDMPRPHYAGAFDLQQVPVSTNRSNDMMQTYAAEIGPKALAMSRNTVLFRSAVAMSQHEAEEQALRFCNGDSTEKTCVLYAVADRVVLPEHHTDAVTPLP